jgi:septal ring factor EnvC (AmiA/AmiB activator)
VFIDDGIKRQQPPPSSDEQEDIFLRFKAFVNSSRAAPVITLSILSVVVLLLAYCTFQYIAIQKCPEKFHRENTEASLRELDEKLSDAKDELKTARQQNKELNQEISGITANKTELTKYD